MADCERIDGEFHFAVETRTKGVWSVYRVSDNAYVDDCWIKSQARSLIERHDDRARHFIAQGKTEERERINHAACELSNSLGVARLYLLQDGRRDTADRLLAEYEELREVITPGYREEMRKLAAAHQKPNPADAASEDGGDVEGQTLTDHLLADHLNPATQEEGE